MVPSINTNTTIMIPLRIKGATHIMGPPRDCDEVNIVSLHIIRTNDNCFVSRWEPTPKELDMLNNGGSVELWVLGSQPPVDIQVAEREDETA